MSEVDTYCFVSCLPPRVLAHRNKVSFSSMGDAQAMSSRCDQNDVCLVTVKFRMVFEEKTEAENYARLGDESLKQASDARRRQI